MWICDFTANLSETICSKRVGIPQIVFYESMWFYLKCIRKYYFVETNIQIYYNRHTCNITLSRYSPITVIINEFMNEIKMVINITRIPVFYNRKIFIMRTSAVSKPKQQLLMIVFNKVLWENVYVHTQIYIIHHIILLFIFSVWEFKYRF